MRLIDTETIALEAFSDDSIPPYAILSHRWEEGELTLQQLTIDQPQQLLRRKPTKGYRKLLAACQKTRQHSLRYLWIDTCCIDKTSSAELSEAINSMFRWYTNAQVCLAFIADIEVPRELRKEYIMHNEAVKRSFNSSVWFTRAWTLQELIAPPRLYFYDASWQELGTKLEWASLIEAATNIPKTVLLNSKLLNQYCIAEKMSWAAGRKATRVEDIAYSLLGIFDVYMPLLYGEGEVAFLRLQEEIIKRSLDRSFLLWEQQDTNSNLFATSPDDFRKYSADIIYSTLADMTYMSSVPFTLNNAGLEIELQLFWYTMNTYAAKIATARTLDSDGQRHHWYLLLKYSRPGEYLYRIRPIKTIISNHAKSRTVKVTIKRQEGNSSDVSSDLCGFQIHSKSLRIERYEENDPATSWSHENDPGLLQCTFDPGKLNPNAYMHCDIEDDFRIYINAAFGFEFNLNLSLSRKPQNFMFSHSVQPVPNSDMKSDNGAKIAIRPPAGVGSAPRWVCVTIDRQGGYLALPDFLCPDRWKVTIYFDWIVSEQNSIPSGVWQIAIIKRKISDSKTLFQSLAEVPFFADEVATIL